MTIQRTVLSVVAMLAVAVTWSTCVAVAQEPAEDIIIAHVPFTFIANGETLPAGEYEVRLPPGQAPPDTILVESAEPVGRQDEYRFVAVTTTRGRRSSTEGRPVLSFRRVGQRAFLESVNPQSGASVRKVR